MHTYVSYVLSYVLMMLRCSLLWIVAGCGVQGVRSSVLLLVTCAKFAMSQAPRPPMDRPIHGEALVKAPPVAVAPMVKAPPVANPTFSCTWG